MQRKLAFLIACVALGGCSVLPDSSAPTQRTARQTVQPAKPVYPSSPENRQCLAQLSATQARYSPLPDKYYGAGCSTVDSVRLSALQSDSAQLELSNLGPVTCPLATTFAGWARYGVDRAARQILGSPLVRIETMGSYNCRNVAGTSRRSAHSTGNAIDVSGFVLADGRRISLKQDWSGGSAEERRFLRIVHKSACKRFGTVLGPQYNAAHKDHFHLENSDSSFCR